MHFNYKLCCHAIVYLLILDESAYGFVKLTNIECKTLDKPFADFKTCRLRVPKRGVSALWLHVKLFQIPVNNVSINLSFLKKVNGYRPFLYNISADFCEFMAHRKRFPFVEIFFDVLRRQSNINHTCPYDHDVIIKNLILDEDMFSRIPVPAGEYMFKLMVAAYNEWKADVRAYFSIKLNKEER